MKIAVGSLGTSLDAWVGGRFGYCPQFIIVDTETMEHIVVPMPTGMDEREASLRAIRIVMRYGAEALIVEAAKPACHQVMVELGVEVIEGVEGLTVREAVERYKAGRLAEAEGRTGRPLKVAVAALGDDLDAPLGMAFAQVPRFVIVDPQTMRCEALEVTVPAAKVRPATVRALAQSGVSVVITPRISPECCRLLWALAIDVVIAEQGLTVAEAIAKFRRGELKEADDLPQEEERV